LVFIVIQFLEGFLLLLIHESLLWI
jgi:hypothetical protein